MNKQAVEIARDVLAQLKTQRLVPMQGSYVELIFEDTSALHNNEDFQTAFNEGRVNCEVCALGGLFASLVHLENEATVDDVEESSFSDMMSRLKKYFSKRDLLLMEYVFEQGNDGQLVDTNKYQDIEFSRDELEKARKYGLKYEDNSERLRAIMLNIIRNKGQFKLPQRVR